MLGRLFCTEPGRRMTLLTTTAEVAALCAELAREPYVAVDTEFMRDRTYFPKLCLVQLAGAKRHAAIDPLAKGIDLAPLFALLADPQVLKVFHAARQDIEIFHRLTGAVPTPLFDTQLAAMVCGYGEEVGYETLVGQIAKGRVDKSSRFTDWSRRPLSAQQLDLCARRRDPSAGDLRAARAAARADRAQRMGRPGAGRADRSGDLPSAARGGLEADQGALARPALPGGAAGAGRLARGARRSGAICRATGSCATICCSRSPRTGRPRVEELAKLRRISLDRQSAAAVVEAVQAALALPEDELPRLEPPPKLPRGLGPMIELLRVLLKLKCEEHHVAQRLVATTGDLEAIATQKRPDVAALKGWRLEVFGRSALALKRGELGLAIADGQIVLIPIAGLLELGLGAGRDGSRGAAPAECSWSASDSFIARHFLAACEQPVTRGRPRRDRSAGPARGRRSRDQLRAPSAARQRGLPAGDDGPGSAARRADRRPRDRLRHAELAQGLCAERAAARRDRPDRPAGAVRPPQARGRGARCARGWASA